MTFFGMALLTAVATVVLAVLAVVTAWYVRRAFLKQAQEVRAIEQQVSDGQELARQQAELLKIQLGQLELQREQLEDQRRASVKQAEVLELQATELHKSLEERVREARRHVREQAQLVFITETANEGTSRGPLDSEPPSILVTVVNSSNKPAYEA
jgi:septal ring factor EnvC (AmiA/AmiB activator)